MSFASLSFRHGQVIAFDFSLSADQMAAFIALSHDDSPIHTDHAFAVERGFNGVVVYGSLLAAQISKLVGTKLGRHDTLELGLTLDFMRPLYVDEVARFRATVEHVSESTATVQYRIDIAAGPRKLAKGRVTVMFLDARQPG